jgi:hypothetical protein
MTKKDAAQRLAEALERWHAQAREADTGTNPVLNDPAPYAQIRLATDASSRPGAMLTKITLTARHADDLASCLTMPGASATSAPWALAEWLQTTRYAQPQNAACWFIACNAAGQPERQVPLDSDGTEGLARQMGIHQVWMAGEQFLRRECPFQEGSRVKVIGEGAHLGSVRGQLGTVTRLKLASADPELVWWCSVRLDHDRSGVCQTFAEGELSTSPGSARRQGPSDASQREPEAGQ